MKLRGLIVAASICDDGVLQSAAYDVMSALRGPDGEDVGGLKAYGTATVRAFVYVQSREVDTEGREFLGVFGLVKTAPCSHFTNHLLLAFKGMIKIAQAEKDHRFDDLFTDLDDINDDYEPDDVTT